MSVDISKTKEAGLTQPTDESGNGLFSEDKLNNMSDSDILNVLESMNSQTIQDSVVNKVMNNFKTELVKENFEENTKSFNPKNFFAEVCGYDPSYCPFEETNCFCKAYIGNIIEDYTKNINNTESQ